MTSRGLSLVRAATAKVLEAEPRPSRSSVVGGNPWCPPTMLRDTIELSERHLACAQELVEYAHWRRRTRGQSGVERCLPLLGQSEHEAFSHAGGDVGVARRDGAVDVAHAFVHEDLLGAEVLHHGPVGMAQAVGCEA